MPTRYPPFDKKALERIRNFFSSINRPKIDPCPWGCEQTAHCCCGKMTDEAGTFWAVYQCNVCERYWFEAWRMTGPAGPKLLRIGGMQFARIEPATPTVDASRN